MSVSAGDRIGPFLVLERLGAGGMGEVYRARDAKLERDVAVKVLPSGGGAESDHIRRFEQEARAASALNHPNIVTIYEVGSSGDLAYIAMELIEGENLRHTLSRRDLTLKHSMRIACRIADGLAAAHEKGIIHRDLKPENVMISRDGFVKILDFGLAKFSRPVSTTDDTLEATAPGLVFGTIAYMSPEQARGQRIDFRSDQFSFGAILHEMFTGKPAFRRDSAAETLAAILREELPRLTECDSSLPPELEKIVSRCLAKDPDERYGSSRDLARDLREVRDSLTRPGQTTSDRIRSAPMEAQRSRRPWAIWAAVVAAFAVPFIWLATRTHDPPASSPKQVRTGARTLAVAQFRPKPGSAPELELLSQGLGATISSRLARSAGLRVIAPAEDVVFAGNAGERLARAHGADYVLRAEVDESNSRVRIALRVTEVATGQQLESNTFTGSSLDLFALEDQIAGAVLRALKASPAGAVAEIPLSGEGQRKLVEAIGLLHGGAEVRSMDQAIARLESLLTDARDSAVINGLLGRAYLYSYRQSRKPALLEQATLYCERAVQLDPSLAEAHVTAGELYLTQGRNSTAESEFRRVLELRPDSAPAIVGLGDTYDALGRASEAEQYYERVLTLVPGWPAVYSRYGRFCFSRGRYQRAVELFSTLSRLVPDSPRPLTNLGAAYHALGRFDEAVHAYQQAIALGPTPTVWSNLGSCQYFLGRFDDASRSFDQALRLSPDNYLLWANAGDAFRWSNTDRFRAPEAYERSIALGKKELSVNPTNALMRAVMGSSLAKLGNEAEAKREIDAALRANPTDADVLYQASVVAVLRKDDDAAILWLTRAVDAGYVATNAFSDPELTPLRHRKEFQELVRTQPVAKKEKESK